MTESPPCACGCGGLVTTRDYKDRPHRYIFSHHLYGRTKSPETRQKIRETKLGKRNASWKGKDAGYAAIHNWLFRHYKKTGTCDECGAERKTEWANITGQYRRDRRDFAELCIPCHRRFDRENPKRPNLPDRTHLRIGEKDAS